MTEIRSRCPHKKHEDRISKLPDDILISIISRLALREATSTSILSSHWRYLHAFTTRLDFRNNGVLKNEEERLNHVNLVNHVLDSHRGSVIKELKVETHSSKGGLFYKKWFEFALTKEAQIIELKMSMDHTSTTQAHFDHLSNQILLHGLKYIKQLSLSTIVLTDQDFDLLVNSCLVLESFSIEIPFNLVNVSLVGHSRLKHFDLSTVWRLESLEIRDVMSLVSLGLYDLSPRSELRLGNIPKLTKLDFREHFLSLTHAELFATRMSSCIRHQLQSLHLSTTNDIALLVDSDLVVEMSVELVNVKQLELVLDMHDRPSSYYIHCLYRLIVACASLQKLIIKFSWELSYTELKKEEEEIYSHRILVNYNPYPKYLKELEIIGYFGTPSERGLALEVIKNATSLEKLIVAPCDLNDTIRGEALARARRDLQHTKPSPKFIY